MDKVWKIRVAVRSNSVYSESITEWTVKKETEKQIVVYIEDHIIEYSIPFEKHLRKSTLNEVNRDAFGFVIWTDSKEKIGDHVKYLRDRLKNELQLKLEHTQQALAQLEECEKAATRS